MATRRKKQDREFALTINWRQSGNLGF